LGLAYGQGLQRNALPKKALKPHAVDLIIIDDENVQ